MQGFPVITARSSRWSTSGSAGVPVLDGSFRDAAERAPRSRCRVVSKFPCDLKILEFSVYDTFMTHIYDTPVTVRGLHVPHWTTHRSAQVPLANRSRPSLTTLLLPLV